MAGAGRYGRYQSRTLLDLVPRGLKIFITSCEKCSEEFLFLILNEKHDNFMFKVNFSEKC